MGLPETFLFYCAKTLEFGEWDLETGAHLLDLLSDVHNS